MCACEQPVDRLCACDSVLQLWLPSVYQCESTSEDQAQMEVFASDCSTDT